MININYEVKSDHRSKFSNLSNVKPEKNQGFNGIISNCLNWKIYCDDHSSLHIQPQYKYELFHIYFTILIILKAYLPILSLYSFTASMINIHCTAPIITFHWGSNSDICQQVNCRTLPLKTMPPLYGNDH